MENSFVDIVLGRNRSTRDVLYEAAMSATHSISNLIKLDSECKKDIELDRSKFHKVFSKDPKSPSILFFSDDEYIIYYPSFSTPYSHKFDEKCKFVEVLKGVIYDKKSDKKFFKGEKFKISPTDNYEPYTESDEAYIRVCVGNCNSVWDQICG